MFNPEQLTSANFLNIFYQGACDTRIGDQQEPMRFVFLNRIADVGNRRLTSMCNPF